MRRELALVSDEIRAALRTRRSATSEMMSACEIANNALGYLPARVGRSSTRSGVTADVARHSGTGRLLDGEQRGKGCRRARIAVTAGSRSDLPASQEAAVSAERSVVAPDRYGAGAVRLLRVRTGRRHWPLKPAAAIAWSRTGAAPAPPLAALANAGRAGRSSPPAARAAAAALRGVLLRGSRGAGSAANPRPTGGPTSRNARPSPGRRAPALPSSTSDAADQHLRLERLRRARRRTRLARARLVDRIECARQQDHGNVRQRAACCSHVPRDLVAVACPACRRRPARYPAGPRSSRGDRRNAVADRDDVDVLVGERELDDALDGDTVVGEQELVRTSVGHRIVGVPTPGRSARQAPARANVGGDEVDDVLHRRAGQENALRCRSP